MTMLICLFDCSLSHTMHAGAVVCDRPHRCCGAHTTSVPYVSFSPMKNSPPPGEINAAYSWHLQSLQFEAIDRSLSLIDRLNTRQVIDFSIAY